MGMPNDGEPVRPYPNWATDSEKEWIEALLEGVRTQGERIAELERRLEALSEIVWRPILEGE